MIRLWDIRAQVLLLALAPAAVVLVILTGWIGYLRGAAIERSLEERSSWIARQVAQDAEYGLIANDRVALQAIADGARREPDVAAVTILDADSALVVGSHAADGGATPPQLLEEQPVFFNRGGSQELIGEVRIAMSRNLTERAKREQWNAALGVGSLSGVLAAALALVIGRNLEQRVAGTTRELSRQKDVAEQADRAKSRFLAAASHDLRQPLHAIELLSSALLRSVRGRGRETRELAARLQVAVQSMDALFGALLDVYRLDSGDMKPVLSDFHAQEVLDGIETEFEPEASRRGLRLRIVPSPAVIRSDPVLLRRVLANLVANALRYTAQGTVLLGCRRDPQGWRFEVRDSGVGIADGDRGRIFEEFYRADRGADRDGGSARPMGLGLTIVERIARLLATRVEVRSRLGAGSVFSIALPAGDPATPRPAPSPEPSVLDAGDLDLIVVDDDPLVVESTIALTRGWRIAVEAAHSIEQASAALAASRRGVVVVIADLWLSNRLGGLDVLEALRKEFPAHFGGKDETRAFGVILTGDLDPDSKARAEQAGFVFLHKPLSAAKLRATLSYFLSKAAR